MTRDDFSEWLVDQMEDAGIDGMQLAKKTGLSRQAITYYIKGERNPTIYSFELILAALGKQMKIIDIK